MRAAPPFRAAGAALARAGSAGAPLAGPSCGAGKSAYRSQTTSMARAAALTRISITPAPRMSAWTVRTGTTAVAFSSMVAGSEGRPPARSRIAKPRKNSSPSAAIKTTSRSEKAAATAKAVPPVAAITTTSAAAWPGRGGLGMPTRICAASTAVSPGNGSPAIVPQTSASVAAKASRSAARCRAISGDIGQDRNHPDPEPGERIGDGMVARVEDDAGAGIVAYAAWWPAIRLEGQLHWEALCRREPSGALARLRQAGHGIQIGLADAPADALHPCRQHATGQHIEHHLGPHARLDVLQAVLAQEGVQPDQPRVEEGQRRLAGPRELADVELQVADHAVVRREQSGAAEVEAGLLECGERLSDLRIVGALGPQRPARLL